METHYEDKPFPATGSGLPRSTNPDKPHITDLIKEIGSKTGLIPNYSGSTWDISMAGDIGFMWEEVLSFVMAKRMAEVFRPGEVERDGIVGSPDGLGPDPWGIVNLVVEEYKATWKSSRHLPWENWYWMAQAMSYCHMLELDTVIMRIAYLNGDYAGSGPQYRMARITFTEDELKSNWRMITEYAKTRGR